MNFYEFNERLKKEKLLNEQNPGLLGMISQGFKQGAQALGNSMNMGFQQIGNIQNAQQMKIDAKGMKNIETHLANVAKQLGVDPSQINSEIQAFVKKITELKASAAPAQPQQNTQRTSAPPVQGDWSSFQA